MVPSVVWFGCLKHFVLHSFLLKGIFYELICLCLSISGEAEAILARSQATAEGIRMVSESMSAEGSTEVYLLADFQINIMFSSLFYLLEKLYTPYLFKVLL
jgi:hypothetical protein